MNNNNGCVNKINYFDKDLMLLVIFGLRGFKSELESRVALRCAKRCYETLTKIKHIKSVSIGVTTGIFLFGLQLLLSYNFYLKSSFPGKTYCGAFGHCLRREYTVIGLIVNKAARIMVAYQNKVTCDRETLLHSKMESSNFILQEYKYLKGIINPGPIYEFKEVEKYVENYLLLITSVLRFFLIQLF